MSNIKLQEDSSRINEATLSIRTFIEEILDESSFVEMSAFMSGSTFLEGVDAEGEGVITGYGVLDGRPVYLFAQNSNVLKGSISLAHTEKIVKCMDMAIKNGVPFISIIDSAGVRIGEGVTAMEGYSSLLKKALELKDYVAHICYVKGNCLGMMSTYASMCDYVIGGADSVISFNAPTVVTAKEKVTGKLTDALGVKSHNSTLVAFKVKDKDELKYTISNILNIINDDEYEISDNPNRVDPELDNGLHVSGIIASIADNNIVIPYNDSYAMDVVCAYIKINGLKVGVLANDSTVSENMTLEGINKAISFISTLDMFSIPLLTLVDSKGVDTTLETELKGASILTAELISSIALLSAPKMSVVIGNAIGYAYTALCSKGLGFSYSLAFANSYIAPLSADTAVNFYQDEIKKASDPLKAKEELKNRYKTENSAFVAAKDGYIDNIIQPVNLRPYLASALVMLEGI